MGPSTFYVLPTPLIAYVCIHIVTPQLIIHDSVMSATHGESVQMTCDHSNSDAIPIRIRWYKNGTLLYTGEKYTISVQTHSYTLHVHNVTENDEGAYNCIADSVHSAQSIGTIHLTGMYLHCCFDFSVVAKMYIIIISSLHS